MPIKKVIFYGLMTGALLQLALGPSFFYVIGTTIQFGLFPGLLAAIAVASGDYVFIIISLLGLGVFLEKENNQRFFSYISSFVLIIFGILIFKNGINLITSTKMISLDITLSEVYFTSFLMTVSSPLTILFWTSMFLENKSKHSLSGNEVVYFGISAGVPTLIFLGTCVFIVSHLKQHIPFEFVRLSNIILGLILIVYGIVKIFKNKTVENLSRT